MHVRNHGNLSVYASTLDFQTGTTIDLLQEEGGHLSVGTGFDREGTLIGNALFRQGSTILGQGYIREARIEGQIQGRIRFNRLSFGPTAVSRFRLVGTPDRLSATQPIALAGQFELDPLQSFTPGPDDSFEIISSIGDITGEFANAPFGQRVEQFGSLLLTRSADLRSISLGRYLPPAIDLNSVPLTFRMAVSGAELGGCFVLPHPAVRLPEGIVAGGTLTVKIGDGYDSAVDRLEFRPNSTFPEADEISFEEPAGGLQKVRFRGTAFGTVQLTGQQMTCDFNAQADDEAAVALLGRLRYENSELTPEWFTQANLQYPQRTLYVTLTDANGPNEVSRFVDFPVLWRLEIQGTGLYHNRNGSILLPAGQETVLHLQGQFSNGQFMNVPRLESTWEQSAHCGVLRPPGPVPGQRRVVGATAPYCCIISATSGHLWAGVNIYEGEAILIPSELCGVALAYYNIYVVPECYTTPGGRLSAQEEANDANSIATFYSLQALMKSTPSGQRLVDLYWQHTAEVVRIFLQHPFLINEAKELGNTFHPGVTALLAGRGDTVTIYPYMITLINNFWNLLAQYASPALKMALEQEQARFDKFRLFQDVTFNDWAGMLGIRIPFHPYFHISQMQREGNRFRIALNDATNVELSLWRSTDLQVWVPVENAELQRDGTTVLFIDPAPPVGDTFYMVRGKGVGPIM